MLSYENKPFLHPIGGDTYKSIGPFDTEEELFNALKEYTDTEVEAGTMSQAEATALLEKYQ